MVALASCTVLAPPTIAQYCAPATPPSAGGYQAAFDSLRHTYAGWITGDGAFPVNLPDGRVVWMFGDTYTGRANSDGSIPGSAGFIHNSFVVQSGPCFAPLMAGSPSARLSIIPDPSPGQWYWPTAGVIEGGALRVFLWHMQQGNGGVPGLNFTTIDMRVASFALPSLTFLGVQPLPFPTDGTHPYGATAVSAADGYVYAYGSASGNAYVARTPLGDVTSGPWQFFTGSAWSSVPPAATPMTWPGSPPQSLFGTGAGPVSQLWVVPYQGGYLGTAEPVDAFTSDVWAYTSASPSGPWTYHGPIAATSVGIPSYSAQTRLNLPGATSPVVVYSTNNGMFTGNPPTLNGYGPHFVTPSTLP